MVLSKDKVVLSKQVRVWLGAGCYARIRCGFPIGRAFL